MASLTWLRPPVAALALLAVSAAAQQTEPVDGVPRDLPVTVGAYAEAADLQVIHPPITTVRGRPDWLQWTGRQAVAIPPELLPGSGRRLIQAFEEGDVAEAVPVDQVLVRAGEEPPAIYVPAGMPVRWAVQGES